MREVGRFDPDFLALLRFFFFFFFFFPLVSAPAILPQIADWTLRRQFYRRLSRLTCGLPH